MAADRGRHSWPPGDESVGQRPAVGKGNAHHLGRKTWSDTWVWQSLVRDKIEDSMRKDEDKSSN